MPPVHTSRFPPQDPLWRNTTATSLHDFARSPLVCAVRPLPKARTGREFAPSCKVRPGVCGSAPNADTHPTPVCICSQGRPRCVQRTLTRSRYRLQACQRVSSATVAHAAPCPNVDLIASQMEFGPASQSWPSPSPAAPSGSGGRFPPKGRTEHSRACSVRPRFSAARSRDAPRASTG